VPSCRVCADGSFAPTAGARSVPVLHQVPRASSRGCPNHFQVYAQGARRSPHSAKRAGSTDAL
jgi:hypothetical protein